MDNEVSMHVGQGTTDLPHQETYLLLLQSYSADLLVFVEVLVDILVSCVLQNEVDRFLIIEKAIQLSDMWVADKGVYFDLSEDVLFDLQMSHLLFVQYF
jgi:hypothetical protein